MNTLEAAVTRFLEGFDRLSLIVLTISVTIFLMYFFRPLMLLIESVNLLMFAFSYGFRVYHHPEEDPFKKLPQYVQMAIVITLSLVYLQGSFH